ncbi:hypothetical protein KR200_010790 [Drosophila serrata]|nr:hypothetical protein KR200_010790 [Drosophila serrata]
MQGCWALTGRGPHSNAAAMQRQSRDSNPTDSPTYNLAARLVLHSENIN